MGRSAAKTTKPKEHRDFARCRAIYDSSGFMNLPSLDAEALKKDYYKEYAGDDKKKKDSFHKTFSRDRLAFENEGFYLKEERQPFSSNKTWKLDKERTLAKVTNYSEHERRTCATLLDALLNDPGELNTGELADCIAKIGQGLCDIPQQIQTDSLDCKKEILETVKEALEYHTPLTLKYKRSKYKECIFHPYGMFSLGNQMYMVGLRTTGEDSAIRTYNLKRVTSATLLSKEDPYTIPTDFNINDYRCLPFELGIQTTSEEDKSLPISLYIEKRPLPYFKLAIHGRGVLKEHPEGYAVWSSDTKGGKGGFMKESATAVAASWCIENDAIPIKPKSLVDAWTALNKEALNG